MTAALRSCAPRRAAHARAVRRRLRRAAVAPRVQCRAEIAGSWSRHRANVSWRSCCCSSTASRRAPGSTSSRAARSMRASCAACRSGSPRIQAQAERHASTRTGARRALQRGRARACRATARLVATSPGPHASPRRCPQTARTKRARTDAAMRLPTRATEAFATAICRAGALWPVAREVIHVAAGQRCAASTWLGDASRRAHLVDHAGCSGAHSIAHPQRRPAIGRIAIDVTAGRGRAFRAWRGAARRGEQTLEIVTDVIHADARTRPAARSVRSVLGGEATGTYLGKVAVARERRSTDAGAVGARDAARPHRDRQRQARARNLRRRREVRARRDGRRARRERVVLPAIARACRLPRPRRCCCRRSSPTPFVGADRRRDATRGVEAALAGRAGARLL